YLALQQSCTDLIGVVGITAADCDDVKAALDAVEMSDAPCVPPVCGDGRIRGAEECDDGNTTDGDGCDSNCTLTACGDGVVTGAEACDDGNPYPGDGCESDCTESPGCTTVMSTAVPRPIPDLGSASSSLSFTGTGGVTSVNVVKLTGTHTYVSDLEVHL